MALAARSGARGGRGRGKRSVPTTELRAQCTLLERAVLTAKLAERPALAPYMPGGAENPAKDAPAWLAYLVRLHRVHATDGRAMRPEGAAAPLDAEQLARAEQAVLDAQRDEPIRVTLSTVAGGYAPIDGAPATRFAPRAPKPAPVVHVHAKSLDALLHVHALDLQLRWMVAQHARLVALVEASPNPAIADAIPEVLATISYTYQLLAWIVTTPGAGMPYASDEDDPQPPAEIRALAPWDVIRICRAHQQHMARAAAVSALLDAIGQGETQDGRAGTRPTWAQLFASLEIEGVAPMPTLMKHRALAGVLASVRLAAARHRPERPGAASSAVAAEG